MTIKEKDIKIKFKEILAETKEKLEELLKEPKEKLEEFINYLDNLEIDKEKDKKDLIQQIEEFELEEYTTYSMLLKKKKIEKHYAVAFTDENPSEPFKVYLAEDVNKKIKLYEELIEEMKCCYNCNALDEEDDTCDITDKCHNYSLWKLKNKKFIKIIKKRLYFYKKMSYIIFIR